MSAARKNATPLADCRRPRRSYMFAASLRSTSQALRTCGGGVIDRQTVADTSLRYVLSELSRAPSNGSLRETASRRADMESPSEYRASAGSWPASVRPRARWPESVNASASAPGPGAAVSPLPMESACCPTDCWLSCGQPQAPGSAKHRRWRTRLPREPSTDAGHDSADARIPDDKTRLPFDRAPIVEESTRWALVWQRGKPDNRVGTLPR